MTSMCEALDLTPNSAETNNFMGVRGYIYSEQGLLGGGLVDHTVCWNQTSVSSIQGKYLNYCFLKCFISLFFLLSCTGTF